MPIVSCDPLPFVTARPAEVGSARPEAADSADSAMNVILGRLMMNEETPFGSGFDMWF
jgi:hypothetical protein